jgi:uncharacterized protein involved in exopolysaccharide biosynthesis
MHTITPRLIVSWFFKDVWKILLISVFFATVSVFYALSLPNIYSSKTKVSSNLSDSKGMNGALSGLGGLASLAGVSLGGGGLSPEVLKEMLASSSFLASFIKKYHIEKEIMAVKSFQPLKSQFEYDEKIYDNSNGKWVRQFKYPQTLQPSGKEIVDKFKESFGVQYDRKTKLITMSFSSMSPQFSQQILENIVLHFNYYMKSKDISDSQLSVKYLNDQLAVAKYAEVKLALQQILEEQYKKLALAQTREEYALRYIESPMLAVKKSGPKRAIICIAITTIGTTLSLFFWWSLRILRS